MTESKSEVKNTSKAAIIIGLGLVVVLCVVAMCARPDRKSVV